MTRIIQCGFETGDIAQEGSDSTSGTPVSTYLSLVTSNPTARSGTYCLKMGLNSALSFFCSKRFAHSAYTEMWYAFGLFPHMSGETTDIILWRCYNTEGFINTELRWEGGVLRAYTYISSGTAATIGATSTALTVDIWHLIEIHHIPHLTNGTFEVYVDGALALSVTGVRTVRNDTNVSFVNDSEFALSYTRAAGSSPTSTTYLGFDDVRVNNTLGSVNNGKPGDGKIIGLVPNGAGSYTQLTPSAGANWQCVDEVPPSTADFVSHATIGNKDTYAFTDPVASGNIQAVAEIAMAQNQDGGGGSIGFLVRSGGVDNEASPTPITATWTYYRRIMELDPTDSGVWTTAKLAALEAGIVVR